MQCTMELHEAKIKLVIENAQITDLLKHMAIKNYEARNENEIDKKYLSMCYKLWKQDYECTILENTNGNVCISYPSKIIIPMYEIASKISEHSNSNMTTLKFSSSLTSVHQNKIDSESKSCEENLNILHNLQLNVEDKGEPNGKPHFEQCVDSNGVYIPSNVSTNKINSQELSDKNEEVKQEQNTLEESHNVPSLMQENSVIKCEYKETIDHNDNETPTSSNLEIMDENIELENTANYQKAPPRLTNLVIASRTARVRDRFPVPALLCNKKTVCRSGTLSCWLDASLKSVLDSTWPSNRILDPNTQDCDEAELLDGNTRLTDTKLLKELKISSIIDLMVDKKKQCLMNLVPITSSEKVDKENRYEDFKIYSLPYPGCEFFKEFIKNSHNSTKLFYDWEKPINTAELTIPKTESNAHLVICEDWSTYKQWDLRTLTLNYLKLIINCLKDDSKESGLLIHCISGWDRTPLYISLLRLTLWAEGLVHNSLDAKQILFLTLAYDWFLFGHLFKTRLGNDENILYFCFEFLTVIINEIEKESTIERHPSNENNNLDSLDIGTPNSFGSTTSLASNASSIAPYPKVSPYRSQQREDHWPFNKESDFSFDGILDGGTDVIDFCAKNMACAPVHSGDIFDWHVRPDSSSAKYSSPRSSLKVRNQSGNELRSRKTSSGEDGPVLSTSNNSSASSSSSTSEGRGGHKSGIHIVRKSNINGLIKGFTKRSRKTSGSSAKYTTSSESVELESSGEMPSSSSTKPVPVPVPTAGEGGNPSRSRHSSNCSSIGSWQLVNPSPSRSEHCSFESNHSSRGYSNYDMVDSTSTITEEVVSTSHGSGRSIQYYTPEFKRKKLKEVRELFYKIYGEIPELNKSKTKPSFTYLIPNLSAT